MSGPLSPSSVDLPPSPAPSPAASRAAQEGVHPSRLSRVRAPAWLQLLMIGALLGAALYALLDEKFLLAATLGVGGAAWGLSYMLRKMVGDEYDRA